MKPKSINEFFLEIQPLIQEAKEEILLSEMCKHIMGRVNSELSIGRLYEGENRTAYTVDYLFSSENALPLIKRREEILLEIRKRFMNRSALYKIYKSIVEYLDQVCIEEIKKSESKSDRDGNFC